MVCTPKKKGESMKRLQPIWKWLLALILLGLVVAMMTTFRFGSVDLPKPRAERITFQEK
jgi:hypothetical protein